MRHLAPRLMPNSQPELQMKNARLDSAERIEFGWNNAANAQQVPVRVDRRAKSLAASGATEQTSAARTGALRGWMRAGARFAANAMLGLLLLTLVPIGVVQWSGARPTSD